MAPHWFGYINVIILQDLAIAGLLWVAARLLKQMRYRRQVAEKQIELATGCLRAVRRSLVRQDSRRMPPKSAVAEKTRAFTAAAG
jgi:hypothetical protein